MVEEHLPRVDKQIGALVSYDSCTQKLYQFGHVQVELPPATPQDRETVHLERFTRKSVFRCHKFFQDPPITRCPAHISAKLTPNDSSRQARLYVCIHI